MYTLIVIITVIAGVLLVLSILPQNSKGGIGGQFGGGATSQVMGAKKSADFFEKSTWVLAAVVLLLSIAANVYKNNESTEEKEVDPNIENTPSFQQQGEGLEQEEAIPEEGQQQQQQ